MHRLAFAPFVLLPVAVPTDAAADLLRIPPGVELEEGIDADAVLRAVQRDELMPLGRVLDILRTERQGEVVEIELDVDDGRVIYDFDVLTSEGRLYAVAIDAVTGQVVEVELEDEDDHDDDED
jgi:uncharacterized membrane protein YkoI